MNVVEALAISLARPCEPVSAMTHLAAALAAAVGASSLVALGRDRARMAVLAFYAACIVLSLGTSGLFHSLEHGGAARGVMQRWDHYAIWILIAGSFTVMHVIACRGFWRWGMLAIIWACGIAGIALQVLWFDVFSRWPGLGLYLGMGWIGLASIVKLGRALGFAAVRPLLAAGVLLTLGALAQPLGVPVLVPNWAGPHELWHLAVIAGLYLHWRFVRALLTVQVFTTA